VQGAHRRWGPSVESIKYACDGVRGYSTPAGFWKPPLAMGKRSMKGRAVHSVAVSKLDKNGKWGHDCLQSAVIDNDACTLIVLSLSSHGRDNDRAGEYNLCICWKKVVYGSKLTALAATTVGACANQHSSKAQNC
jgi:hypothetical protein